MKRVQKYDWSRKKGSTGPAGAVLPILIHLCLFYLFYLSYLLPSIYLSSSLYLLNNLARRPPVNLVYNLHKPGHLVPGFPALRNQVHAHLEHMKHPLIHGHPALYSGPPGILGHLQRIA